MTRRLGRGLGSLLGSFAPKTADLPDDGQTVVDTGRSESGLMGEMGGGDQGGRAKTGSDDDLKSKHRASAGHVSLDLLRPNPYQVRDDFDEAALERLAVSLKQHGFLQPLCVRASTAEAGAYEVISGERRWRAAAKLGLAEVPVTIREGVDNEMMLELAMVENLQREDLNAMERARGFRSMMAELGLTQEKVADRVGLKRATVANHLRLLELPEAAREALQRGLITMGHGRALLGLDGKAAILRVLGKTVREDLSVRALEEIVRRRSGATPRVQAATVKAAEPWVVAVEARLLERLGTRAVIKNRPGYRGTIQIEYHDREDLDRLLDIVAPQKKI